MAQLRRFALRLWLLCAVAASILGAYAEIRSTPPQGRIFGLFYSSTLALQTGGDPYGVTRTLSSGVQTPNLNPPIWFLLFGPLTALSVDAAAALWAALTLAGLVAGLVLVQRGGGLGAWRSWRTLAIVAGPIVWETFAQGQVYTFLIAPLAGAALYLRREKTVPAAVLLGLIIALKPPLFVVVVAAFWINRRLAIWTALASAAWTLLPLPLVGIRPYLGWLAVTQMAPVSIPQNASLTAFVIRWAGQPSGYVAMLLLVALVAIVGRRLRTAEAALTLGVVGGLVASPITWPSYFVLLLPGLIWIGRARGFSRLFDGSLLVSSCPLWVYTLSPLAVVPIYALGLVGFFAEALRAGLGTVAEPSFDLESMASPRTAPAPPPERVVSLSE